MGLEVKYGYDGMAQRSGQPDELNFYGVDGLFLGVYRLEWKGSKQYPVRVAEKERVYFHGRLMFMGEYGTRVHTDRLGSVVRQGGQSYRNYPYGQEIGGATANEKPKFGTYTRDAIAGLDYAMNSLRPAWTPLLASLPKADRRPT